MKKLFSVLLVFVLLFLHTVCYAAVDVEKYYASTRNNIEIWLESFTKGIEVSWEPIENSVFGEEYQLFIGWEEGSTLFEFMFFAPFPSSNDATIYTYIQKNELRAADMNAYYQAGAYILLWLYTLENTTSFEMVENELNAFVDCIAKSMSSNAVEKHTFHCDYGKLSFESDPEKEIVTITLDLDVDKYVDAVALANSASYSQKYRERDPAFYRLVSTIWPEAKDKELYFTFFDRVWGSLVAIEKEIIWEPLTENQQKVVDYKALYDYHDVDPQKVVFAKGEENYHSTDWCYTILHISELALQYDTLKNAYNSGSVFPCTACVMPASKREYIDPESFVAFEMSQDWIEYPADLSDEMFEVKFVNKNDKHDFFYYGSMDCWTQLWSDDDRKTLELLGLTRNDLNNNFLELMWSDETVSALFNSENISINKAKYGDQEYYVCEGIEGDYIQGAGFPTGALFAMKMENGYFHSFLFQEDTPSVETEEILASFTATNIVND